MAAARGQAEVIPILAKRAAELEFWTETRATGDAPLCAAASFEGPGRVATVQALLEAGANVNAASKNGSRPIHNAARRVK